MIHEQKKENESNESLIRRFTRKVQSSGVLLQKKSKQFYQRKMNKHQRRASAIRRKKMGDEYAYLVKIGRIVETTFYGKPNARTRK